MPDPHAPSAPLPALGRQEPAARRSGLRQDGGFDKPILHGLCTFANVGAPSSGLRRRRPDALPLDPRPLRATGHARRDHRHRDVAGVADRHPRAGQAKERDQIVISNARVTLAEAEHRADRAGSPTAAPCDRSTSPSTRADEASPARRSAKDRAATSPPSSPPRRSGGAQGRRFRPRRARDRAGVSFGLIHRYFGGKAAS